ncbi:MAG: tungsten cofactor oxidoreductase radical SAM maturase [archaeon GB-1867-005]|nr:tungsten cofactor oxidoreductase radical SAM maturase [Candidatus Culexmicrobium cathedralense]
MEKFEEGTVIANPSPGPRKAIVELTTRCNLNCPMCFRQSWTEELGDISEKLFKKILLEFKEAGGEFLWLGGWGEPLIHKKAIEFAEMIKEEGLKLGINSNGLLLDEDKALKLINIGLDRLVISIDASTQGIYEEIRGGDINELLRTLKFMHEAKKKMGKIYPKIEFSFTLMRRNMNELIPLIELAASHGVNMITITNVIPVKKEFNCEKLYGEKKEEVERLIEKASIKSLEANVGLKIPEFTLKTERSCPFVLNMASCVTWNGLVSPCFNFLHTYKCYIYNVEKTIKQVIFGNATRESLSTIWRKQRYVQFRFRVRFFKYPSCTDCKFHEICHFTSTNELDCWGNAPSCADCLFSRGIILCPI